jgi:hypothetical protein
MTSSLHFKKLPIFFTKILVHGGGYCGRDKHTQPCSMVHTFKGTVEQAGRNGAKTDVYMLVTNNFAHIFTKIYSTPLYENFDRFSVAQTAEYLHIVIILPIKNMNMNKYEVFERVSGLNTCT